MGSSQSERVRYSSAPRDAKTEVRTINGFARRESPSKFVSKRIGLFPIFCGRNCRQRVDEHNLV
jgi:hypothetical protein